MKTETKTKLSSVKVTRLEVCDLDKDARGRWRVLCEICQFVENTIWQEWLVWHANNGSRDILESWLAECRKWHTLPKKDRPKKKPKLDLQPLPKELQKHIASVISSRFVELHSRVQTLILNVWQKTLKQRKSANGNLSGWINILMNRESIPSATKPMPIPFDVQNSELVPPEESGGNYGLSIRLWRMNEPGKKMSPSVKDTVELWTKGRKRNSQATILRRCLTGEYKFCGSSIQFKKGKVYALICYQMPQETTEVDPNKIAFLRPCKKWPLKLRINKNRRPGGNGRAVESNRKQISLQRYSRQQNYRVAGSSNKGHGRDRATQGVQKLSERWKDFTKSWNHTVTTDIVRQLVEGGYGSLVWFKPTDQNRDSLFLSWAGQTGKGTRSSWDYFQIETMLKYKCKQKGIELIVK